MKLFPKINFIHFGNNSIDLYFMKHMKCLMILITIILLVQNDIDISKMIVIYYTRTGNTGLFVDYIKECINITTYQINPVTPYPLDSKELSPILTREREYNLRPQIINPLTNINDYDKILVGFPIWTSHVPNIVYTQLLKLNFAGKVIYPFNTHEGSEAGSSFGDVMLHTPGGIVKKGVSIRGSVIRSNKKESLKIIQKWLHENFGYVYDCENKLKFKFMSIIVFIFLL